MNLQIPSRIDAIDNSFLKENGIELFIKRDDLIHPVISGNKWRKLKFNLDKAKSENYRTILTFGGAYSNHLHATAFAAKEFGFKSIGIIRGVPLGATRESPEGNAKGNDTLTDCQNYGMYLHFISREEYRRKNELDFITDLRNKFGNFYLIPEGGANYEGISGCIEILKEENQTYDFICCTAGTGTTLTGVVLSLREGEKLLGFPSVRGGEYLKEEIEKNIVNYFPDEINKMNSLQLICNYHFGGFAKVNDELKNFVKDFFDQTKIQLDLIYNGKMMFGLFEMIRQSSFKKGTRILVIHCGGIQGNRGFIR
jgi:1-aminocyclopropane-1-carboxylate deaminase